MYQNEAPIHVILKHSIMPFRPIIYPLVILFGIGLQAQPMHWEPAGIGGGGAMFNPSVSPFDSKEYYLTSDMSGIFHSTDRGGNWEVLPFSELMTQTHNARVNFTSDPNILYSTGYTGWPEPHQPLISKDGGKMWSVLPSDPTGGNAVYLYADPNRSDRLIVTDRYNVYLSGDSGKSFSKAYTTNNSGGIHIGGVFWDGQNIFVGTNLGLLVSKDSGSSFKIEQYADQLADSQGMLSFTGAKAGGKTILFCVAKPRQEINSGYHPGDGYSQNGKLYRLEYGSSAGWQNTNANIPSGDVACFVDMSLRNTDVVYVAVYSEPTYMHKVYKSSDSGKSWTSMIQTSRNQNVETGWMGAGGDMPWAYTYTPLGFTVAPNDPNVVVITEWMWAHTTNDGGKTWQQMYVPKKDSHPAGTTIPQNNSYGSNGLEVTSAWYLTWADESNIFASYTDITGNISTDGGKTWSRDFNFPKAWNTTYHVVKHPSNGKLYASVSSQHDLYQNSIHMMDYRIDNEDGAILVSSDKGKNWSQLYAFGHPVIWMAIDPNNPTHFYASVVHSSQGGIYHSSNSGSSWRRLATPPRTTGHPFNIHVLNDGTLVATYSGHLNGSGAFRQGSGVFVSTDKGNSWADRSDANMTRWTKDIVIDPHDPAQNTWYACVQSHWGAYPNEVGGIYKTTDRGKSWTRISEHYGVSSIAIHPQNPNIAYICAPGGEDGLQYSSNFSCDNPTFTRLDDYPFYHPVRAFINPYQPNEVWVTSFGIGLRKGDLRDNPKSDFPAMAPEFTGAVKSCSVELKWSGSSDEQLSYFELERSTDNVNFSRIFATDPGSTACSPTYQFEYMDQNAKKTNNYRLKRVNLDGSIGYSEVFSVSTNCAGLPEGNHEKDKSSLDIWKFYPNPLNPSNPEITIEFTGEESVIQFMLTDQVGRHLRSKRVTAGEGLNTTRFQLDGLPAGVYFLYSQNGDGKQLGNARRLVIVSE